MATTEQAPQAQGWRVIGQSETTRAIEGGRFVSGVVVSFTTGQGHTGSVFVPENQYTPDVVRRTISSKAAQLDAVGNLTG